MYKIKNLSFDEPFDFNEFMKNIKRTSHSIDISMMFVTDLFKVLKALGYDTFEKAKEIMSDDDFEYHAFDYENYKKDTLKNLEYLYEKDDKLMSYKKTGKLKVWTYLDPLQIHGIFIKNVAESLNNYNDKFLKLSKYGNFEDLTGSVIESDNGSDYMEYAIQRVDRDYLTNEDIENLNKVFYRGDDELTFEDDPII